MTVETLRFGGLVVHDDERVVVVFVVEFRLEAFLHRSGRIPGALVDHGGLRGDVAVHVEQRDHLRVVSDHHRFGGHVFLGSEDGYGVAESPIAGDPLLNVVEGGFVGHEVVDDDEVGFAFESRVAIEGRRIDGGENFEGDRSTGAMPAQSVVLGRVGAIGVDEAVVEVRVVVEGGGDENFDG